MIPNLTETFARFTNALKGSGCTESRAHAAVLDVAMMFDTTGSMYPYLKQVRAKLHHMAGEIASAAPNSRMGIIAFGDYGDRNSSYLVTHLPLTAQVRQAQRFINEVAPTGGDDRPEAVEEGLHAAVKLQWRREGHRVAVLVGDAPPHGVVDSMSMCEDGHFYRDECRALRQLRVPVYTVQCGNDPDTASSFQEIASITRGRSMHLEAMDELPELIVGACMHQTGDLNAYATRLNKEGRMTENLHRQFTRM